eukprot:scaffold4891_cov140-Cylindrotheca_fusiformis.AAC.8
MTVGFRYLQSPEWIAASSSGVRFFGCSSREEPSLIPNGVVPKRPASRVEVFDLQQNGCRNLGSIPSSPETLG